MSDIKSTVKYEKPIFIEVEIGPDALDFNDAHPFARIDYHEDGSKNEWYGFEISAEEYKFFMSMLKEGKK